ncbi:2-aminoethylphosphonate--pyruvate transaminase [Pseudoalteromonas spongiae]|uniref:2-aminoethylphosphonate--pyruvate transaminase n=1 Tax=Pseudoalteromonas spongiae TaxID=298657 RepID=UPI000C2D2F5F|nr:2-aminoethylphosphonate--pyruvate transaminase [Pseudoalteromonas spongiae]
MNEYLLLTPGPLSTSNTVKQAMLKDWCTWDDDYNIEIVEAIRAKLTALASNTHDYTSVLMQGSGTASVESALGSLIKNTDKLLIINNGAYGKRIAEIANYLNINAQVVNLNETQLPNIAEVEKQLQTHSDITHIAMVHCETTTGMLNPVAEMGALAKKYQRTFILDAMSSFGGIELDMAELNIDVLISSANKCIQGVPGFGFVIVKKAIIEKCQGIARSLSLDLYAQWKTMEDHNGKWRFTSPTHVVRAFYQALLELEEEGGVKARYNRYKENQQRLVDGMHALGFDTLLAKELHSPIITSFYSPTSNKYNFALFYSALKEQGFVIYPGKVSDADCFRIGNIGEIYPDDITRLLSAIKRSRFWLEA